MERLSGGSTSPLKKGAWTVEEDQLLSTYIMRYGHWNWQEIPKYAGLSRCGKSCRVRWMNYLRPSIKRGNYTKQEDELIVNLHEKLGDRWSAIAASLPGRTDSEIKNHWQSHLSKKCTKENTELKEAKNKGVTFETTQILESSSVLPMSKQCLLISRWPPVIWKLQL